MTAKKWPVVLQTRVQKAHEGCLSCVCVRKLRASRHVTSLSSFSSSSQTANITPPATVVLNSRPELSQIFNIPANVCKYFPFQGLWHQNVCFPIWPVLHSLLKLRDRIRLTNCLFVSSRLYSYQMLLLSKGRFTFVFLSWKCLHRQTQRNGVSTFAA